MSFKFSVLSASFRLDIVGFFMLFDTAVVVIIQSRRFEDLLPQHGISFGLRGKFECPPLVRQHDKAVLLFRIKHDLGSS